MYPRETGLACAASLLSGPCRPRPCSMRHGEARSEVLDPILYGRALNKYTSGSHNLKTHQGTKHNINQGTCGISGGVSTIVCHFPWHHSQGLESNEIQATCLRINRLTFSIRPSCCCGLLGIDMQIAATGPGCFASMS